MNSKPEHWRDELYKAYVERWQAREAAESESRKQAGKISIWLERASDDADTFTAEHQAELRAVVTALRDQGIGIEAPFMAMDAADAVGGYTGQIVIELIKAASPLLTGAVIAWLKGGPGGRFVSNFTPAASSNR